MDNDEDNSPTSSVSSEEPTRTLMATDDDDLTGLLDHDHPPIIPQIPSAEPGIEMGSSERLQMTSTLIAGITDEAVLPDRHQDEPASDMEYLAGLSNVYDFPVVFSPADQITNNHDNAPDEELILIELICRESASTESVESPAELVPIDNAIPIVLLESIPIIDLTQDNDEENDMTQSSSPISPIVIDLTQDEDTHEDPARQSENILPPVIPSIEERLPPIAVPSSEAADQNVIVTGEIDNSHAIIDTSAQLHAPRNYKRAISSDEKVHNGEVRPAAPVKRSRNSIP